MFLYLSIMVGAVMGIQTIFDQYVFKGISMPVGENPPDMGPYVTSLGLFLLIFILSSLLTLFLDAYAIRFTANLDAKRREDIFTIVLRKIPGIIAIYFIIALLLFGSIIVALLTIFISPVCACFSMLIVFILIFIVSIRLIFAVYPLILNDVGVIDSLHRSWDLTSGKVVDVLAFIIIAEIPVIPFVILSAAIPRQYYYVNVALDFVIAYMSMVSIVMMTRGYMELERDEKRKDLLTGFWMEAPEESVQKPVFGFGLSGEEIQALNLAGINLIPVSFRAEQTRVGDLIAYSDFYAGDPSWYPRRVLLMHGMGQPEMKWLMDTVSYLLSSDIIFGTINIHNVDMSVGELLNALAREHDSRKV